ncbi:hypothetical protein ASZ78_005894, partial [Callipepla squamata]
MEIDLTLLVLIIVGMFLHSHEAHDSVKLNLVVGITILIKVVLWYVFFILLRDGCVYLCRRVGSLQEELQNLRSQAQHWEMLHRDSEQTLAIMKEELTVCKAELAFLKKDRQKVLSAQEQCRQEVGSLQEDRQMLNRQSQHCLKLHWEALKYQDAFEEEMSFHRQERQQVLSAQEQSRQEVGSLQEEPKKLSIRAENCEQVHFEALESQTAREEELASLRQEGQQVLSAQEQCRQEVGSLQEELKKLSIRAENCEQVHFEALESQTAREEELASLRQEGQQVLSAQEQCRQEVSTAQAF